MTDPTTAGTAVNSGRLWAGGVAAALVAALIALIGILICRGILDIAVLAPKGAGTWGNANTMSYMLGAAAAALAATALIQALLMFTPSPYMFFGWVVSLTTIVAVLLPFAVSSHRASEIATAVLNFVLGVAIGTLVSASAHSATQPVFDDPSREALPPPYRQL